MPDGDVIPGLRRLYHQPYQAIVEGKATDYECSLSLLAAIKKDIQQKGDPPIRLAQEFGKVLNDAISQVGMINAIDHARLSSELEKIVQHSGCPYHSGQLVLHAGGFILCALKYGVSVDISNLPEAMIRQYMVEILEKEFIDAIPLAANNFGVDASDFQQRIPSIKSQVLETFDKWASKADSDSSVKKLRMPNRQASSEIDLEEDLLMELT